MIDLRTALCILIIAWVSTGQVRGQFAVPRFEPETGAQFPVQVPAAFESTTGYLVVLENRERPDGPTVRLPVAIVHARTGGRWKSPVLYLGGGPGSSALNVAAYPGAYPFTGDRDFIVMEQRGTRYAEPALTCPVYTYALQKGVRAASGAEKKDFLIAGAAACRARLEASGIDRSAYHTAASAADIEDLRQVLGVEKWTLYGVSYGTRLALAVMRDYPASVRAAVLDSALPPQIRYDDESAVNLDASFHRVFRDCASDPDCEAAFPNLRFRFYAALEGADTDPVEVSVGSGDERLTLALPGARLAGLVDTSSPSGIAEAPRLMDAMARRDTAVIASAAEGLLGVSTFAWGMRLSVWCSEALPFSARATAAGPGTILRGLESAAVLPEVCAAWNVPVRPRREASPVASDVPTLLVAGEYDPFTPAAWAEEASLTLPRSRVAIVRGEGHTPMQQWSGDGCAMQVAAGFIADPMGMVRDGHALLDCLAARMAPTFVTEDRERATSGE